MRLLVGRLNERTLTMLRAGVAGSPDLWGLTGWIGEAWLTFHRVGEPPPRVRPPRIDHVLRISLGHDWFPLYGPWLLPSCAHIADRRLAHYVRGLIWQAEGKHENAAIEFRAAVYSQTLGYTRINLELARTLISLGQFHEATRILRSALAGSSDGPGYYVTRTEVHEWLARNFEAVRQPDSAAVHYRKVAEAWKYGDAPFRVRANAATQKVRSLER